MKIKELYLKNFKSVVEQSFQFNDGIICFSGNNGEGKSTVIHAILILLFNSYDMSFKDYINWNAAKFFISTVFEHNGQNYYEEFEYGEKSGSKRLLKNLDTDEIWENSSAISILSTIINPDLAKASIVAMENEQNLITTTPAKRREYLKGLYNLEFKDQLDYISKDLENLSQSEMRYSSDIAALEKQVFDCKSFIAQKCTEEEYNSAKNEISKLIAKKGELELKKANRQNLIRKIDELNLSIRRCSLQSITINDKIRSLQEDISNTQIKIDEKKIEDKLPELEDKLNNVKVNYKIELSNCNSNINKYNDLIANLKSQPDFSEQIGEISIKIIEKTKEQYETKVLIKQSKDKLNVLMTGVCPTCGHVVSHEETETEKENLSSLEKLDASLDSDIISLKNSHSEFTNKQKELTSAIDNATSELNKSKSYLDTIKYKFEREISNLEHDIEKYTLDKNNSLMLLQNNIDNCLKMIESQKELKSSNEEMISQYNENLTVFSSELDKIDDPESAIVQIDNDISPLKALVKTYEDTENYNKYVLEYNNDQNEKRQKRDHEVESIKENLHECIERRSMVEKAKTIISREFPSFVISYMVKSLENYTNEFLQKVYPKYNLRILESKNSLAITYGPNNADVKMASGFEKSAFSLAYMYALGKMQKYGLLIIDEGDGAASDENSLLFYNTVAKSQEFFPQIFCITHKEVVKDLLENTYKADLYTAESGKYFKN